LGAELAFEHLAGIPTEALTSMQFARYTASTLPRTEPGTNVVIGISVSGEVSRTLEALQQAKANGAVTVALTATPGSRIFNAAEHIYNTLTPDFPDPEGVHTPGVRSYVANQMALYLAAIRIGEVRGKLTTTEANAYRKEVLGLAEAVERTIAACDAQAKALANDWADASEFVYLGAGPNFASALFSAAKILEASGDPAMGQDTEEYGHLQYFAKAVSTPTFIISNAGAELSRANEIATAAKTLGRRVVAVAPASATFLHKTAYRSLPLTEGVREMFSPIVATVPGELFAAYRSEVVHEPFFRNFGGGRSTEGGGGISRIRTSDLLETH
jgi:glucosamine--fructose-6-phosphate aminotransferase (isomerizing)